jgi:hypothetical protein
VPLLATAALRTCELLRLQDQGSVVG